MDTEVTPVTDPLDPLGAIHPVEPDPLEPPPAPAPAEGSQSDPDQEEWDAPDITPPGDDEQVRTPGEPAPPLPDEAYPPGAQPVPDPEPETADQPAEPALPAPPDVEQAPVDPGVQPNETADAPAAPAEPAGKSGQQTRPYAILEGFRLRDVLEREIKAAGGTLTLEVLGELMDADNERYRERHFVALDNAKAINKENAIRALHKRVSESGGERERKHLAVFPAHYWKPQSYDIGTTTTVSVDPVKDDD